MLKIGSHVGMSGKEMFLGSVKEAVSYGANTFMIYTGAPQNTRRKPIEELKIQEGKAYMKEHGIDVDVIIGSKTKDMLLLEDEMKAVAGNYYPCTDDGTYGHAGMVTSMIEELAEQGNKYDVCVAIGPMIMMKFVCLLTKKLEIPTIVSMNPIMVDGTGMCGACRLHVGDEIKFACVDGPEFDGHLVNFDEAMKRQQMYKTAEGRAMLKLQEGDTHHGGCGHCGGDN